MLSGADIVYIGGTRWDAIRQRLQHIAQGLAQNNRVLFVNSIRFARLYFLENLIGQRRVSLLQREGENLFILSPPFHVPYRWHYEAANAVNYGLLAALIRYTLRRLAFEKPILWIGDPLDGRLLGRIPARMVCYDCTDEYEHLFADRASQQAGVRLEQQLLQTADLVFATSQSLLQKCRAHHPRVYLVPNGVEFEHFIPGRSGAVEAPIELRELSRPVIGYIGTVGHWVDLDLVAAVARQIPKANVVMVGPIRTDVTPYQGLPNLYFLGPRLYCDLPAYLHAFDVALIPFQLNDLTRNVNPVKLYEYLAAGKPVIATALPELERYRHVCSLAAHPGEFVERVQEATAESEAPAEVKAKRIAARVRVAAENTWQARVEHISSIIGDYLCQTRQPDTS